MENWIWSEQCVLETKIKAMYKKIIADLFVLSVLESRRQQHSGLKSLKSLILQYCERSELPLFQIERCQMITLYSLSA